MQNWTTFKWSSSIPIAPQSNYKVSKILFEFTKLLFSWIKVACRLILFNPNIKKLHNSNLDDRRNYNSRDSYQENRNSSNWVSGDSDDLNYNVGMINIKHFEESLILIWPKASAEFKTFVERIDLKTKFDNLINKFEDSI